MAKAEQVSRAIEIRKDSGNMAVEETVSAVLQRKGGHVWHIAPQATVFQAIAEMADRRIGALAVVTREELVGIITERDYARKVILQGRSSRDTTVQQIMSPSPIAVTPAFTVNQCLRIMTIRRFRHLPVVDSGALVGIISMGDLVSSIISNQAFTIDQLQTYIAAEYPG